MTNKTTLVLNGYIELTGDEREELKKAIQEFDQKDVGGRLKQRSLFNEEVKRIMGPTSSGICPACGRG